MSNSLLAQLDAQIHAAMAGAGMADVGEYRANANAAPVQVRCYVDRETVLGGEYGPLSVRQTTLALLRGDVPAPQPGALVDLDGQRYELDARTDEDEGLSRWVVIALGATP